MTMQITIEVPERLGEQLKRFQDRLPELLERGIREIESETQPNFEDERSIVELLTSRPTPEQIIGIRPSPQFQERVSDLLTRSKTNNLTSQEEAELERYLMLEHLVRIAKAHAYQELHQQQ